MWITQPAKFVVKLSQKPSNISDEGNGYPEILAFLKLCKFLGDISSFEQLFYRKKSLCAPEQLTLLL